MGESTRRREVYYTYAAENPGPKLLETWLNKTLAMAQNSADRKLHDIGTYNKQTSHTHKLISISSNLFAFYDISTSCNLSIKHFLGNVERPKEEGGEVGQIYGASIIPSKYLNS